MDRPVLRSEPPPPVQAGTDSRLIDLWLRSKRASTRSVYTHDIRRFLAFVDRPLGSVTLEDLLDYRDSLAGELAESTVNRYLGAVKSLLTFAVNLGYLRFNPGKAVELERPRDRLNEKILSESAVHRLIAHETNDRNRLLLRLLYETGTRISELVGLVWKDIAPIEGGAIVTVHGKGGRTRSIRINAESWRLLCDLRDGAGPDDPVFRSRQGGSLDRTQAFRIVRAAADRANLDRRVHPHMLRHSHVSHALDRGAPVHLVAATVGHASLQSTTKYAHVRPGESSGQYLAL